jgi:hypothetical protein
MDPLDPITPPASGMPSRRVPAVDRLPRVSREGDRPRRDPSERRPSSDDQAPFQDGEEGGEGHIDVRV